MRTHKTWRPASEWESVGTVNIAGENIKLTGMKLSEFSFHLWGEGGQEMFGKLECYWFLQSVTKQTNCIYAFLLLDTFWRNISSLSYPRMLYPCYSRLVFAFGLLPTMIFLFCFVLLVFSVYRFWPFCACLLFVHCSSCFRGFYSCLRTYLFLSRCPFT